MKYYASKFEEYLNTSETVNLHSNIEPVYKTMGDNIEDQCNLIFYGPAGVGKYTQVLNYIKKFSQSNLRFERKINFNFQNKKQYIFKVSDIHFEIDMSLLGCHAKLLWHEIYNQIVDIISSKQNKKGIIEILDMEKM